MSDSVRDRDVRTHLRFSIPIEGTAWADNLERACVLLEDHDALPREKLLFGVVRGKKKPVKNRMAYLRSLEADPYRNIVVENGRSLKYTRTGTPIDEGLVLLRGGVTDTARLACELTVECPALSWPARERLLAELGDVLEAYAGELTPSSAMKALAFYGTLEHMRGGPAPLEIWQPRAQPLIDLMHREGVFIPPVMHTNVGGVRTAAWQPESVAWINYWSPQTCQQLGFPDPSRDADLLQRSYQTPRGGWIVKISDAPLDVQSPAHIRSLAEIYERFPAVGLRVRARGADTADSPAARFPGSTTYLHDTDHRTVVGALTRVFESVYGHASADDGGSVITVRSSTTESPVSATVSRGTPGWTVIRTQPAEILADADASGRPLIAALCAQTGATGFMLSVRNPEQAVLVESDSTGRVLVSGFLLDGSPSFHGMPLKEEHMIVSFDIVPVEFDVFQIDDYVSWSNNLDEQLAGRE